MNMIRLRRNGRVSIASRLFHCALRFVSVRACSGVPNLSSGRVLALARVRT